MIKFALAALIATSAPAMAIDLKTNINALVNIASAAMYCGMPAPQKVTYNLLMDAAYYGNVSAQELADAIDAKAYEFGSNATPQQISKFCAEMKMRYKQAGISHY